MIVTRIIGGLGNQMFQYAIGRNLAIQKATNLQLDTSAFKKYKLHQYSLDEFNLSYTEANELEVLKIKFFKLIKNKKYIKEKDEHTYNFSKLNNDIFLEGYWQNEYYFIGIKHILTKEFGSLRKPMRDKVKNIKKTINSHNHSVSVHIRRGDYINNPKTSNTHGNCSLDYYHKAINEIIKKTARPTFFCFSDDIDWVKKNLKINAATFYPSELGSRTNIEDLYLMSKCRHHIIANSTFSWWGAWLGEYENSVIIGPKKWFVAEDMKHLNIMPVRWMKIQA